MTSSDNNNTQRPTGPIRFWNFDVTTQVFLTTPHSFALVNLKPLVPGHVLVCPRTAHKRLTDLSGVEITDLFSAVQRVQHMLARYYFTSSSSSSPHSSPPLSSSGDSTTKEEDPEKAEAEAKAKALLSSGSFNIAIQDGVEAGQTVPHVHVHVVPRIRGATGKDPDMAGDAIYELMAAEAGNVGGALWDREMSTGGSASGTGSGSSRPRPGGSMPRIEDADRLARSMADMEAEAAAYRGVLASMGGGGEGKAEAGES